MNFHDSVVTKGLMFPLVWVIVTMLTSGNASVEYLVLFHSIIWANSVVIFIVLILLSRLLLHEFVMLLMNVDLWSAFIFVCDIFFLLL